MEPSQRKTIDWIEANAVEKAQTNQMEDTSIKWILFAVLAVVCGLLSKFDVLPWNAALLIVPVPFFLAAALFYCPAVCRVLKLKKYGHGYERGDKKKLVLGVFAFFGFVVVVMVKAVVGLVRLLIRRGTSRLDYEVTKSVHGDSYARRYHAWWDK